MYSNDSNTRNRAQQSDQQKVSVSLVEVGPEVAAAWLERNTLNRNVRRNRVREFAQDMRNGKWHTDGDAIRFDWNGVLQNGQHRLLAILESGATITVSVMRGLDPDARAVMDTNSRRTAGDALKFIGVERYTNELAAVARITLARESGYATHALSPSFPTISHSAAVDWVESHPSALSSVEFAIKVARPMGVPVSGIGYCVMELRKVDPLLADEFFESSADFRTDGRNDPRSVMLNMFRASGSKTGRRLLVPEIIFIVFTAWNAWVTERPVTHMKLRPRGHADGARIPDLAAPTPATARRLLAGGGTVEQ